MKKRNDGDKIFGIIGVGRFGLAVAEENFSKEARASSQSIRIFRD